MVTKAIGGIALSGVLLLGVACGTGGHEEPKPNSPGGSGGDIGVAGYSASTAGSGGSVATGGNATAGGTPTSGGESSAGAGNGDSGGAGGAGGEGGSETGEGGAEALGGASQMPPSSDLPPHVIRPVRIDKIDLVFMVDNSISMTDKQAILRDAVPVLVNRLITPGCLDENGERVGQVDGQGRCASGLPEFEPVKDVHIAIVTSSLGAHGGQVCDPAQGQGEPSVDDRARPLGLVRPSLAGLGWDETGFLAWDPDAASGRARNQPPGTSDANTLRTQFQSMISAVGEVGCGYEASLESWYRFLIDPAPPGSVTSTKNANGDPVETVVEGVDTTLLELRSRFLRPDSLVAIVMLTDENDCSIVDERQSWLVGLHTYNGRSFRMPRSTSVCDADPNDPCCTSCAAGTPPAGCAADPVCSSGAPLTALDDNLNLRCFRQQQRFGFDFLQPVSRYVDGLTKTTLTDRSGNQRPNPLYVGLRRDSSMIFLVGIVGVPWQDVSTRESWAANAPLEYLSYDELEADGRFAWMLPAEPAASPLDGLMFETTNDRTTIAGVPQTHPGTGHAIAPSGPGATPGPNPMNGRETSITDKTDLQFACTFPLSAPRVGCDDSMSNCDCRPLDAQYNRSICNGTTQTHAKAYPGIRQIEVLRGVGKANENAVVASICPKLTDAGKKNDPSYGYTPAISAIVERLRVGFARSCLSAELPVCSGNTACEQAGPGQADCAVIEASPPAAGGATCAPCDDNPELPGRKSPTAASIRRAHVELERLGSCGGGSGVRCEDACLCEILQHDGADLSRCQSSTDPLTDISGFCYVDPPTLDDASAQAAAEAVIAACPDDKRHLIRFTGKDFPAQSATMLLLCTEP